MANQKKKQKLLHGNQARIDPHAEVLSGFISSMVTQSPQHRADTNMAIIPDDQVEAAREFVNENQK